MRFKMHENSLFSILLRSSWWISFAITAGIVLGGLALLPADYRFFAVFAALPFFIIGCIAVFRQARLPSVARVRQLDERLRQMGWPEFSKALIDALNAQGYATSAARKTSADYLLTKHGRVTALACRRWKVSRTGVETLRQLTEAMEESNAHDGIYVALGEVTDGARRYAAAHRIRLYGANELALFMRQPR